MKKQILFIVKVLTISKLTLGADTSPCYIDSECKEKHNSSNAYCKIKTNTGVSAYVGKCVVPE
jgi:hypothetical protein